MKKSIMISLFISVGTYLALSPIFWRLTSYLHPIVLAVLLFCIFFLVYFFVLLIRKESIRISYRLFLSLFILYSIGLLILLFLRPNDQSYNSMNLIPFSTISFYLSGKVNWLIAFYNLAANVGLFIPYGIYLLLKNYSPLKLIFIPMVLIAFIEIMQLITHRGSLDIDDLILNLAGVFLGYLFFPLFKKAVTIHAK
ncbi:VanZ family protein [Neobacillus sp.]|uniref:VanZ family protein n=1 Tax=Neobacillus sp. TaxID=2675273 RepID=UPI002898612E|nr:VanZ family protein [Neobacillus sp.]